MSTQLNLFVLTLLPFFAVSQEDKLHFCSHAKTHTQTKSATLSLSQIAETELYDVHYYFLNLQLTNLSTNVTGQVELQASALENLDSALLELSPGMTINN